MFLFSDKKRYSYNLSLNIAAQVTLLLLKSNIGTWGTSVGLYGNVLVGLLTLQLHFEVYLSKNTVMSSLCPPSSPRSKGKSKSMRRSGILLSKPHHYAPNMDTYSF